MPKLPEGKAQVNSYSDAATVESLKAWAKAHGMTFSALVDRLLTAFQEGRVPESAVLGDAAPAGEGERADPDRLEEMERAIAALTERVAAVEQLPPRESPEPLDEPTATGNEGEPVEPVADSGSSRVENGNLTAREAWELMRDRGYANSFETFRRLSKDKKARVLEGHGIAIVGNTPHGNARNYRDLRS